MKKFCLIVLIAVMTTQVNSQVNWAKDPDNPVLTKGTPGKWDDLTVGAPEVLYDGYTFHMWSGGGNRVAWDWKTGYAVSTDGTHWEKISANIPVMNVGEPSAWDDQFVAAGGPEIMMEIAEDDTVFKMWFGGGSSDGIGKIGYASSDTSAPAAPIAVQATFVDSANYVTWDENTEADLHYYTVFRKSGDSNFKDIAHVKGAYFMDYDIGTAHMYAVSATDISGNECALSDTATVTVLEVASELPLRFNLLQNYPNPFNPTTTISYQLAKSSKVILTVYNLLGQKIVTLVNMKQQAGNHFVRLNASGFASGVYLCRLETDSGVRQTKKMMLLK